MHASCAGLPASALTLALSRPAGLHPPRPALPCCVLPAVLQGDHDTVNCLEPHPHHLLTLATSGIEDTIKLWTPTAAEPQVRVVGRYMERVAFCVESVSECVRSGQIGTAVAEAFHRGLIQPTRLVTLPQVLGREAEGLMATNQREQGEERRMFLPPQMLQMLLRARQMGGGGELPGSDSEGGSEDSDNGEEEGEDGEGEGSSEEEGGGGPGGGGRRRRQRHGYHQHPADCTIS